MTDEETKRRRDFVAKHAMDTACIELVDELARERERVAALREVIVEWLAVQDLFRQTEADDDVDYVDRVMSVWKRMKQVEEQTR